MEKITKKGIKKAIIIYYDPEIKDYRRVVFGDPDELLEMFVNQVPIILERIEGIRDKKPKTPKELARAINKTLPSYAVSHGAMGAEDAELALSYQVKRLK